MTRPPVSEETFLKYWLPLFKEGLSKEEIINEINCSEKHYRNVMSSYRDLISQYQEKIEVVGVVSNDVLVKKLVALLKAEKYSVLELATLTNTTNDVIHSCLSFMEDLGYAVRREIYLDNEIVYFIQTKNAMGSIVYLGGKTKTLVHWKGLGISDTHGGNKKFNKTGLSQILQRAQDEYGVTDCFHTGDLTDGYGVYDGQLDDLKYWKEADQVKDVADVFSQFNYNYYIIPGNHDYSWEKRGAPNPVRLLSTEISNVTALPEISADILIYGVLYRLIHGDGGGAYAMTYPLQKYLRNLLGGSGLTVPINGIDYKLQVLQFGHTHRLVLDNEYGIYAFCPGNFLFATNYTTRKGLVGPHGGFIIEMDICDGEILNFTSHWLTVKEYK